MSCMSPNRPTVPNLIHQIGGFQQRLKDPERNKTGECEDSTYLTLEKKKTAKNHPKISEIQKSSTHIQTKCLSKIKNCHSIIQ